MVYGKPSCIKKCTTLWCTYEDNTTNILYAVADLSQLGAPVPG